MKSRYTRDKERGGYRYNFRQANGKYTTLRAATIPEMEALIRARTEERDAALAKAPAAASGPTVSQALDRWLEIASAELAYRSREALTYAADKIRAQLGEKRVSELAPSDVDELMLTMSGMSSSAKEKVLRALRRLCKWAMGQGWLASDPTDGKRPGGTKPKEVKALSRDQQTALLAAVSGTRANIFVMLCLRAGLRREEALGLTWDHVHLDDPAWIEVAGTVTFHGQTGVWSESVKTAAARRRIPIPDDLAAALAAERVGSASRFVIHGRDGGPCTRNSFRSMWEIVLRRFVTRSDERHIVDLTLDFAVHPHQLRHTYISELCAHSGETGLDLKTIQYLAGHTSPVTTLKIYAHVMAEKQADTAAKIRRTFDGSSPESSPDFGIAK